MKTHKLRSSIFFVILVGFFTAANAQTGLKDVYANQFRVGNILNSGTINNNGIKTVVLREFNSITHENELKPDQTMTRQGSTDDNIVASLGTGARNVLKFCEDNNIPVRGHVLVWHGQSPHWFFTSNLTNPANPASTSSVNWATKEQMEKRLKSYINNLFALIKKDYPNLKLYAYDVVNEAVDVRNGVGCPRGKGYDMDGAGGVDPTKNGNSPWVQIYGDNSFIESAFKYAAEARDKYFPNMKLFYNDYNEWDTPKKTYIIDNILKPLKAKGYLDGMGMQGHIDSNTGGWSSDATFKKAMDDYAALGIEVQITELDVGKNGFTLQQQAAKYKMVFDYAITVNARERAKGNPGFTAIIIWGPNDANSWRNDEPTLFDRNNQPKEAYNAVFAIVPQSQWGDGNNPTFLKDPTPVCKEPAPTPTPNNLVSNGIFSGTTLGSSWSLTNVSGGAEASASVECNKAKITITKVGTEIYQPQLVQQGITLEEGKIYELSFKASAAANRTIEVKLERIGGDGIEWGHTYGDAKTFNLTSTEGTYTLKLDMTDPTDKNVQLAFNLGGVARDVTISDVKLLYIQDIPFVCKEPEATPIPNNLVKDGVFFGTELSSSWSLGNVSGGAEASAFVECNKARIAIAKVGTEIYQPQLIQQGITLEQGRSYELSFKASAAADRTIIVQLERMGGGGIEWGYTYGSAQTFNLTSTEDMYILTFDMTDPTDKNVQLAFNLGGIAKDVTISDVALVSMETTSINTPGKLPFVTINGRTLSLNASNSVKVNIFDIHGKIVAKFSATGNSTFSLNDIPAGIYFVEIKGQGVESTTKIVLK